MRSQRVRRDWATFTSPLDHLDMFVTQFCSSAVTEVGYHLKTFPKEHGLSRKNRDTGYLFCPYLVARHILPFQRGRSSREYGTVYMGTGNCWQNGSCIFQSFMNYPLHSCRKLISSPFLFGIETNPWLILLLGEERIWKWLFFFKKEITFLLPFYFFLYLEWNMGLRSLFFIISPKHYIWWQLVNWVPQPQLSFWVQTSV